jgi:hypothetical protein
MTPADVLQDAVSAFDDHFATTAQNLHHTPRCRAGICAGGDDD